MKIGMDIILIEIANQPKMTLRHKLYLWNLIYLFFKKIIITKTTKIQKFSKKN
jgi:hypothetical protein